MELVGKRIRNIQVQERLGRGGMGEVYLGFDETLERKVALKAIRRRARMSVETKTRFLREARVLSQLEHPHICRIYDFLEHEGREILVLEYVDGETLGEAMTRGLSYREKLVTAIQIAEVLVAAHATGVIHRDLKPDNVMRTRFGKVKVLDFGLARPLAPAGEAGEGVGIGVASDAVGSPGLSAGAERAGEGEEAAAESSEPVIDWDSCSEATELGGGPWPPRYPRGSYDPTSDPAVDRAVDPAPDLAADTLPDDSGDPTYDGSAEVWNGGESTSDSMAGESVSVSQMTSGTGVTDVTLAGSVVGTVSYMSPEQARGENLTTASDMYSLGIILHELFTGQSAYGEGLTAIAKLQRVSEGATLPVVDIDSEVAELVRGLERPEPALRPRAVDVLERLRAIRDRPARRRRQALAAGLLLALLGSGVKYTIDLEKEQSRTLAALAEAEKARIEAQLVSDFMVEVFEVSDPSTARGQEITAREVLEQGASRLDDLQDQPEVQARLLRTFGRVHYNLGLRHDARIYQERALEILRQLYPEGHLDLATSLQELGDTARYLDDYESATELYRQSVELRRELLPKDHPELASSLGALGHLSFDLGRLEEARDLLEESVAAHRAAGIPDPEALSRSSRVLANTLSDLGDPERAEELHLESIAICEQHLGMDHPRLAVALQDLGSFYVSQSRYEDGERALRSSLAIQEKVLDPTDPNIAINTSILASISSAEGEYGEAEDLLLRSIDIFATRLGPSHFNVGAALLFLGKIYYETGRWEEAREAFFRSLRIAEQAGLEDNYNAILARRSLGAIDLAQGRWQSAETSLHRSLEKFVAIMGESSPESIETLLLSSELATALGRAEDSTRFLLRASTAAQSLVAASPDSPESRGVLAVVRLAEGRALVARGGAGADARLTEALGLLEGLAGADRQIALVALRAETGLLLGQDVEHLLERLRRAGWASPRLWALVDTSAS